LQDHYTSDGKSFSADEGTQGRELWRSDGTSKSTRLVKDIVTGSTGSNPEHLTVMNGILYFAAAGGLWKSDGTAAGTALLKNVPVTSMVNVIGTLFFTGSDGASGSELWRSDGTTTGTVLVKDSSLAARALARKC
jgi:ELWxxDGT repeat protein